MVFYMFRSLATAFLERVSEVFFKTYTSHIEPQNLSVLLENHLTYLHMDAIHSVSQYVTCETQHLWVLFENHFIRTICVQRFGVHI